MGDVLHDPLMEWGTSNCFIWGFTRCCYFMHHCVDRMTQDNELGLAWHIGVKALEALKLNYDMKNGYLCWIFSVFTAVASLKTASSWVRIKHSAFWTWILWQVASHEIQNHDQWIFKTEMLNIMCHGLQNRHELKTKLKGFHNFNCKSRVQHLGHSEICSDIIPADHCTFVFDIIITFC